MNSLRLIGTIFAFLTGLGGVAVALQNINLVAWTTGGIPPAYLWSNLVAGVLIPAVAAIGLGTIMLLVVRIDRRLEQLQTPKTEA